MRGRKLAMLALAAGVSLFAAMPPCFGQGKSPALTRPIVIDPSVAVLDKAHAVKAVDGRKFFVADVTGGGADGDSAVGYTRTGRKTVSPIMCDPGAAEAVRLTVSNALSAQGLLAGSEKDASFVIDVAADLKLTEETKKVHQSISAVLKVEVAVWDVGDPSRVKKFRMEAVGERKTLDTTKQAELAAREAVRTAVGEILKSLDSL